RILISTPYAMSVREIHLALGDEMKREWTADALERLKVDDIDEIGILPTRYYVRGRDPKLQYDNSKL
ncbi:hypothetical protein, partial [Vibrio alginolyticus]|uniref:hypothetical protein n=1 Tax=Vibrio alginolyticus TaxID=663 RepID=UPI001A8E407F